MDSCKRLMAVAIVGFDSSRPARLLELLGGPEVPCRVRHVGRVEEVGAVDAVLLCTRDGREHAAQALPLLARGISVWVDKPLATTEADARAMVRAAVDGGLVLACRSGLRDAPAVRRVAEWVRETPGPVTVRIEGPAPADNPYGGRAFYGIHHVELACELARSPLHVDGDRLVGADLVAELVFRDDGDFTLTADGASRRVEPPARYLEDQVTEFLTRVRQGLGTAEPEALVEPVRLLEHVLG